jgi:hypothetical protein
MSDRARWTLWLSLGLSCGAQAQAPVEGVNPADLLTQVQLAAEYNRIDGGSYQSAFAVKYDQSFAGLPVGINAELPLLYLGTPFGDLSGHGDLFVRFRYVKKIGAWAIGAASEVVAPVGEPEFSSGRWQLNPAGLGVYAWDPFNISAVVHKRVYGYGSEDPAKADLNQYQWRFLQIHIWPTGWFAQADVSRWRDVRNEQGWNDLRFSVGKQLSATRRVQVELKKFSDSRENDLAINMAFSFKL